MSPEKQILSEVNKVQEHTMTSSLFCCNNDDVINCALLEGTGQDLSFNPALVRTPTTNLVIPDSHCTEFYGRANLNTSPVTKCIPLSFYFTVGACKM